MIEHVIPETVRETPLERYLKRAWPMTPGRVWRDVLQKRDVRVNGVKSDGKATVRGGDALTIYAPDRHFLFEPDILWTDDKLIALVKPRGLPVDTDSDGVGADTLLTRLKRKYPNAELCHRLDAQTGGIVLAAADETVYAQALEAFKVHGVRKTYQALALNRFERASGTLDAYLIKDARRAEVRVVHRMQPGAREIETRYRAGDPVADGVYRVWLEPVTGRTHQLRAHMADYGHPLIGDDRYGDRAANKRYAGSGLCLWHETLYVPDDSPLEAYRGRTFHAPAPEWKIK